MTAFRNQGRQSPVPFAQVGFKNGRKSRRSGNCNHLLISNHSHKSRQASPCVLYALPAHRRIVMEKLETLALTESETAQQLGVSISGLRKWRNSGTGPRFVRIGRLVRYLVRDVETWLAAHTVDAERNQLVGREQ